jgi:WD40 repeat protein
LTSVALNPDGNVLYAGCWDTSIWSWDVHTRKQKGRFEGHVDFVKTVVCVSTENHKFLISGGADAQIIIWDASSGTKLHVLKGHSRGIQDLGIDPILAEDNTELTVFSAASDRSIRHFRLPQTSSSSVALSEPILEHETSVYRLFFDDDGDLWTASADKTAKCLSREAGWKANLALDHPDFVRDVVVHERGGWVVTACRDEEVRVWSRAVSSIF